jgi:methionyl aminopeptidase
MVELKTAAEIEQMRAAGRVVAAALTAVKKEAAVGVSLRELDEVARDVLRSAGAVSLFEGYQPGFATGPYPRFLDTSGGLRR